MIRLTDIIKIGRKKLRKCPTAAIEGEWIIAILSIVLRLVIASRIADAGLFLHRELVTFLLC